MQWRAHTSHFFHEILRVRWALILSVAFIYLREVGYFPRGTNISILANKCSLATIGFILAHIIRQQAFGYIDLGDLLRDGHPNFGLIFLGMALIYAAFILAIAWSF